jgi:hypothetical protein
MTYIFVSWIVVMAFIVYMFIRINAVFKYRNIILDKRMYELNQIDHSISGSYQTHMAAEAVLDARYKSLPSSGRMVLTFWVWPMSKFEPANPTT